MAVGKTIFLHKPGVNSISVLVSRGVRRKTQNTSVAWPKKSPHSSPSPRIETIKQHETMQHDIHLLTLEMSGNTGLQKKWMVQKRSSPVARSSAHALRTSSKTTLDRTSAGSASGAPPPTWIVRTSLRNERGSSLARQVTSTCMYLNQCLSA